MSSSKRTALGEVVIPSPFYQLFVSNHDVSQLSEGTSIKTITVCQINVWSQPELGFSVRAAHMDVHRFARVAFVGIEEKPERFVAKDDWHGSKFNDTCRLGVNLTCSARGICASSYQKRSKPAAGNLERRPRFTQERQLLGRGELGK